MPRALITGITGQDGQYLAEFLKSKGYDVFGLVAGQANPRLDDMVEHFPYIEPLSGDLRDLPSLIAAVEQAQPDEVYNLGAISFVALSFKQPELTAEVTGLGVLRMLEAIRVVGGTQNNPIRFYQASSSEMFGKVREVPQNEQTAFHPRSPYGVAKVFGHKITVNYREAYGTLRVQRDPVQPRVASGAGRSSSRARSRRRVARIKLGLQEKLALGTLETRRDWGYAPEYVQAMWLHAAAARAGRLRHRDGRDAHRPGVPRARVRARRASTTGSGSSSRIRGMLRPAEVDHLIGDASKAKECSAGSRRCGSRSSSGSWSTPI